jgi:hypothetical protein
LTTTGIKVSVFAMMRRRLTYRYQIVDYGLTSGRLIIERKCYVADKVQIIQRVAKRAIGYWRQAARSANAFQADLYYLFCIQ